MKGWLDTWWAPSVESFHATGDFAWVAASTLSEQTRHLVVAFNESRLHLDVELPGWSAGALFVPAHTGVVVSDSRRTGFVDRGGVAWVAPLDLVGHSVGACSLLLRDPGGRVRIHSLRSGQPTGVPALQVFDDESQIVWHAGGFTVLTEGTGYSFCPTGRETRRFAADVIGVAGDGLVWGRWLRGPSGPVTSLSGGVEAQVRGHVNRIGGSASRCVAVVDGGGRTVLVFVSIGFEVELAIDSADLELAWDDSGVALGIGTELYWWTGSLERYSFPQGVDDVAVLGGKPLALVAERIVPVLEPTVAAWAPAGTRSTIGVVSDVWRHGFRLDCDGFKGFSCDGISTSGRVEEGQRVEVAVDVSPLSMAPFEVRHERWRWRRPEASGPSRTTLWAPPHHGSDVE